MKIRRPYNPKFPYHTGFTRETKNGVTQFSDRDPRRPPSIEKVFLDPKDYDEVTANDIILEN